MLGKAVFSGHADTAMHLNDALGNDLTGAHRSACHP
jgi:hypothetical protein